MEYSRYQGFIPSHKRLLETLKPGDTVNKRDTKLAAAGDSVIYGRGIEYLETPWESMTSKIQVQYTR